MEFNIKAPQRIFSGEMRNLDSIVKEPTTPEFADKSS